MEPALPAPRPEAPLPAPGEFTPVEAEVAPNTAPDRSHEGAVRSSAAPPAMPMPVATPQDSSAVLPAADPVQATDDATTPQIADDVDLIEKEWVDKAKKIVNDTKHDPHEQEKQVSYLQADYLMKRYNKQIKVPE